MLNRNRREGRERRVSTSKSLATASEQELYRFRTDHADWKDWSIMTDTYRVWISQQAMGASRTDHIEIPRTVFNRLVREYLKERRFVR